MDDPLLPYKGPRGHRDGATAVGSIRPSSFLRGSAKSADKSGCHPPMTLIGGDYGHNPCRPRASSVLRVPTGAVIDVRSLACPSGKNQEP